MVDPFAAVYADPDDDAPRAAVAAELVRAGDVRGEVITTQLARARGERIPKDVGARERALLKAHAKVWLAPYGDALVASSVKWERGFPVAARLNFMGQAMKGPEPEAGLTHMPALATLRRLEMGSPNLVLDVESAVAIALLPALRTLREVTGLPRAALVPLAHVAPASSLERIVCLQRGGDAAAEEVERAALDQAFAKATGLPMLRELDLSWVHTNKPLGYRWLFESAMGARLETLALSAYYLGGVIAQWHEALSAAPGLALTRLALHHGWQVTLERDGVRFRLRGSVASDRYQLIHSELHEAITKTAISDVAIEGYKPPIR